MVMSMLPTSSVTPRERSCRKRHLSFIVDSSRRLKKQMSTEVPDGATQLINFESDDYTCKVAKTLTEATQSIEAGFDYVTEIDIAKLFRKGK